MALKKLSVWILLSLSCTFIPIISALGKGNLGCFVDLSQQSDRKTDVVIYYEKNVTAFKQTKIRDFDTYATFEAKHNVESVSAMDFTHNGVADLFVVTHVSNHKYQLTVWEDKQNSFEFQSDPQQIIDLSEKDVLIIDANSDFIPDVFGKKYVNASDKSSDNASQTEGFWFGKRVATKTIFTTFVSLGVDQDNIDMKSVSFIDLDQDCKADLVYITKTNPQVKMISGVNFDNNQTKQVKVLLNMSRHYQSRMYFADVNKDGAMDIIIPTRDNNTLYLFLQKESLTFKTLCSRTKDVVFDAQSGIALHIKGTTDGDFQLKDNLPIIVQDINMDSQINIVAVLQNQSGEQKVFVNIISQEIAEHGGDMKRDKKIEELFVGYTGAASHKIKDLAFFHSGEFPLGLHFLIQKDNDLFDWIDLEPLLRDKAYGFLSICPLNNVSPARKRHYGGSMPGVTVKAFFRSRNGNKIFLNSGSLYQTNGKNHLLPFIVFGLGDPESYIEKLVIGYSIHNSDSHTYSQPGVPPNSQLVLFAYGKQWRLETFLAPYITAPILAVIIAVVMTILGAMWLYLEIQEKKSATHEQLKAGSTTANNFFF